jgi:hypothetical protein
MQMVGIFRPIPSREKANETTIAATRFVVNDRKG